MLIGLFSVFVDAQMKFAGKMPVIDAVRRREFELKNKITFCFRKNIDCSDYYVIWQKKNYPPKLHFNINPQYYQILEVNVLGKESVSYQINIKTSV